jgi:hypothetical protein
MSSFTYQSCSALRSALRSALSALLSALSLSALSDRGFVSETSLITETCIPVAARTSWQASGDELFHVPVMRRAAVGIAASTFGTVVSTIMLSALWTGFVSETSRITETGIPVAARTSWQATFARSSYGDMDAHGQHSMLGTRFQSEWCKGSLSGALNSKASRERITLPGSLVPLGRTPSRSSANSYRGFVRRPSRDEQ